MATGDKGQKSNIGWRMMMESPTAYGAIPGSGNVFTLRTRPGASVKNSPTDKEVDEVQPDRMSRGTSRVANESKGSINSYFYLNDPALRLYFQLAMMNTPSVAFAQPINHPAAVNFTGAVWAASDNSVSATGIGTGLIVGQRIKATTTTLNNGFWKVAPGTTANKVILSYGTVRNETIDTGITPSIVLKNGILRQSCVLEQFSTDIARVFTYSGSCLGKIKTEISAEDYIMMSYDFQGLPGGRFNSTQLPGTPIPATSGKALNAGAHITGFRENGALYVPWHKIGWDLDNQLSKNPIGGQIAPADYSLGKIKANFNAEFYFVEGDAAFDRAFDGSDSSMDFQVTDDAANTFFTTFPSFTYTGDPTPSNAESGAGMATITGTAKYDPATNCVIQFDFF